MTNIYFIKKKTDSIHIIYTYNWLALVVNSVANKIFAILIYQYIYMIFSSRTTIPAISCFFLHFFTFLPKPVLLILFTREKGHGFSKPFLRGVFRGGGLRAPPPPLDFQNLQRKSSVTHHSNRN